MHRTLFSKTFLEEANMCIKCMSQIGFVTVPVIQQQHIQMCVKFSNLQIFSNWMNMDRDICGEEIWIFLSLRK